MKCEDNGPCNSKFEYSKVPFKFNQTKKNVCNIN